MRTLNFAETKIIGGGVNTAKAAVAKRSCEVAVCGGLNERHGAYAEVKVVFKFGG